MMRETATCRKRARRRLKMALDEKKYRKGTKDLNRTIHRMRLIVLIAVTTGMRCVGDIRASVVGRYVRRRIDRGAGKAEGRQDALRPDASGTRWEIRRYPAVDRMRTGFSRQSRVRQEGGSRLGRQLR